MATENQLRARIPPSHAEHLDEIANENGIDGTEAERQVLQEGLATLGYVDRPIDGPELFLWYIKRMGLVLGLVGLIMMGYGVFGPRLFSITGFGLLLAGFLFVALEEGITEFTTRYGK